MSNPIGWFELYVEDIDRAQAFYQTVLDCELTPMSDPTDSGTAMLAFPSDFSAYGAAGALIKMDGMSPGAGGTMVYFSCDDCAVQASRVVDAGGKLTEEKTSIGDYGFCAMAVDTEGNAFGLHSDR
jgi:predicted enzyme related to lactoylglutathione lyase